MPETEWSPATPLELSRLVAENAQGARRSLAPVGGRTALHYGGTVSRDAIPVSLAELNRVIDYPARDMTITVEAGLRWETLQKELARQGQRLPIDVPQARRATVGGAVATNTSGPGRYGYGTFRDYVIGISAIDGTGRLFSAGGRVVKNVAGYDFCKLLTGSLGTLGIITQITFKLKPVAEDSRYVWVCLEDAKTVEKALGQLNLSRTRPVVIEVLNEKAARQLAKEARQTLQASAWNLCLGFEGMQREVAWQVEAVTEDLQALNPMSIGSVQGEDAGHLREALTEYQASSDDPLTFQGSVPSSGLMKFLEAASRQRIALQAHAGNGVVIGHLPDSASEAAAAAEILSPLRTMAESLGGALTILSCEESWKQTVDVYGKRPASWKWNLQLKSALDPQNLLNPGRIPV